MLNRFPASNALCMRNYKFKFNCIAFRFNLCNKCICAIIEWHACIFWVSALSIITAVWHSHTGPSLCRTNWKLHQRSQWSAPNIQIIEWFIGWTLWIQSHTHSTRTLNIVNDLTRSYSHMFDGDLHRKCTNYVFNDERWCVNALHIES